ncbi:MAG: hypothetical protein C0516_12245 [Gemmatimonas sp.]|uniref:BamA/TamA family outer membrane protein n=1 Tax=Gemmatimonas sp. UBA7669 TaxID=1946568 RepID=UPI0025C588D7|nr:BamA/TamA family outer membrane protein [Gemmatimonas sp. UBA7669]MBA3919342.1 hypothetical protein [Gemmatimonas sp.]
MKQAMARTVLRSAALLAAAMSGVAMSPSTGAAQRAGRLGSVPRDVALEVTRVFNAPSTRRVRGDFTLAAADTVRGDLAVLNGNARLAGVVYGDVVVLNGDVFLQDGARLEKSLTVLGGTFEAPERPNVVGDIRVWSSRYRYREDADTLIAETDFFARWSRWVRDDRENGAESQLFVTTAHTYNRVEGLPILVGPRFRLRAEDTRVRAEVFGIFRTGDGIEWKRENLGHQALLEVRQGNRAGVALGGKLFDVVDAMEQWQLTETEVGLNSFLFTRDYRDYWQRHGGEGYVALFAGKASELRASYGEERWSARPARDPWTLFNSDLAWRRNPTADEGVLKRFTLSAVFDTRTNSQRPRSGWFLRGEYERGTGTYDTMGELTPGVRPLPTGTTPIPLNEGVTYSRAFFDLRRYNRLGPNAQLNLRAVFGGWVNGDPLPVQRRFSVSGIDALPGFDFRRMNGTSDVGTCATGSEEMYASLGRPAQCERMALLQAEWKGDFRINLFGDDSDYGDRRWGLGRVRADGAWVVFANTGRGWLIDRPSPSSIPNADLGPLVFDKNSVPGFDTWRTDIGGGFDFGDFGVYIAQAVSQGGLSPNVYVRLSRRF